MDPYEVLSKIFPPGFTDLKEMINSPDFPKNMEYLISHSVTYNYFDKVADGFLKLNLLSEILDLDRQHIIDSLNWLSENHAKNCFVILEPFLTFDEKCIYEMERQTTERGKRLKFLDEKIRQKEKLDIDDSDQELLRVLFRYHLPDEISDVFIRSQVLFNYVDQFSSFGMIVDDDIKTMVIDSIKDLDIERKKYDAQIEKLEDFLDK
jgi:hypothetical protein